MSTEDSTSNKSVPPGGRPVQDTDVHEAMRVFRAYGPVLVWGLGLATLLIAGFTWVRYRSSREQVEAERQWEQAETAVEFDAVASRFPRTPSGALALLEGAAMRFHEGLFDEAADTYDRFLKKHPRHPMSGMARLNRYACEEAMGRLSEARAGYEAILSEEPEPHIRTQAVLALGRVLSSTGAQAEARAVYEDYLLDAPDSTWTAQVEAALREVNRRMRTPESHPGLSPEE